MAGATGLSQNSPPFSPRHSVVTSTRVYPGTNRPLSMSPPDFHVNVPMRPPIQHAASAGDPSGVDRKPPPANMEAIPWYHFSISRHIAESLLISTGEDGSYLLRDSGTNQGEYTLSVRSKNAVKHFPVRWDGEEFTFGFGKFKTVEELMEHFQSKPVIGGDSGILTLLKFHYPRVVEEPELYDNIRIHAEGGDQNGSERPTFAIASKEGYLTKLGQHRKNWKTRWFVLFKNELSYYKTREERAPIRTIDLKDVSSVVADSSQHKENAFKIITNYRTFFVYACSSSEAEEWIRILRWKLEHPSGLETIAR